MKRISRDQVIYKFTAGNRPAEKARPGELVVFETIDALGGQVKDESTPISQLDWSKVNGATGPLYVEGAEPGDTLVVDILDVKVEDQGVILVVPGFGGLPHRRFEAAARIVKVDKDYAYFGGLRIPVKPMIGTIGVAPSEGEYPTGTSGRYGGNMDVSEVTKGTRLYFPVFVEGGLLAMGDLHAVQADGEICVSAVEVSGEVLVRVDVIKGRQPKWPILETEDSYHIIACGDTLDEAAKEAAEAAVESLRRARSTSFEDAYMLSSLTVDLKVNQVVDPKKGVRAKIPKYAISLEHLLQ